VVLVDPGHGGADPGARGNGVVEKEVNLAVGTRLAVLLHTGGALVHLTRDTDVEPGVDPTHRNYAGGLRARRAQAGQRRATMVVSVHSNHIGARSAHGPAVFYHRDVAVSVPLAEAVAVQLRALAGRCPIFPNGQLVLYTPGIPAINVELGFLSNAADARRLADPAYQARLARAIGNGLTQYWQSAHGGGTSRGAGVASPGPGSPGPATPHN
jgi:N-acetylmuramoyl-L-alanine amidase